MMAALARLSRKRFSSLSMRFLSQFQLITTGDNEEMATKIAKKTDELFNSVLTPINRKVIGPLSKNGERIPLPFVLLLGNHSSGKSTFINYILGRSIQTTGVAPTDDGFTIIAPGKSDDNQDGPSLIGNPDFGFSELRSYGPTLMSLVQLKVRESNISNFMLVDTPGMIDAPGGSQGPQKKKTDRGYDFQAVVRWFAERADVIFLFFDPDKPGTTGETLEVLTHSLSDLDHKIHIVLNKVDLFANVSDFARAYGSLCWNLSKVIPRKDMPRIHTMGGFGKEVDESKLRLQKDLEKAKSEVVEEAKRAPERRIDNMITHLYDSASYLQMHCTILEAIRKRYSSQKWRWHAFTATSLILGQSLAFGGLFSGAPWQFAASISIGSVFAAGAFHISGVRAIEQWQHNLLTEGLQSIFTKTHHRQISEGDEYALSLWTRVQPQIRVSLQTLGVSKIPRLTSKELSGIERIISQEVPSMRRNTSRIKT